MARDEDENWRRRKEREKENEEEERGRSPGAPTSSSSGDLSTEKLFDLISRAEPLIEQVNNLYNMYLAGVDKIPPNERRSQLDQLMVTLQLMSKPTPSANFRYNAIWSRYQTYKDRWDKMLRDLESGKIKRTSSAKG